MSFKSREDIYHSVSFETQEEALDFIKSESARLKKDGFTVMDMGVREMFGYSHNQSMGAMETEPEGYAGVVQAKKETPSDETEDAPKVN